MMAGGGLQGLPRTALITLRARADEGQHPRALFADAQAVDWLKQLGWPTDYDAIYTAALQTSFAVRTRLIDDAVQAQLKAGQVAQVLDLGAGLSTRYSRLGQPPLPWIELDLPDVITLRRRLEEESDRHRFVGQSLLDPNWLAALGSFSNKRTLIIAEGVLLFLPPQGVQQLFKSLRAAFSGAPIVVDIAGGLTEKRTAPRFAQVDAPMRWFAEDETDLARLGVSIEQVWPTLESFPARWGDLFRAPSAALRNTALVTIGHLQSLSQLK
ncbi:MAG: class I SAM-dependent methyltransferase [Chloroflexi bacterium]|nr:class I SAM-dependent methyltransferase [Chloroflexota bacterium]